MDDFWEFLGFVGVIVLALVLMIGILGGASYAIQKVGCNNLAAMNPNYWFEFNFWAAFGTEGASGCYVKYGDLWIPTNNIQLVNGAISTSK